MKIFSQLTNWLKGRLPAGLPGNLVLSRSGELGQAWLRGEESWSGPALVSPLEQSVWVYSCVTAISEQVAQVPFVFSLGQPKGEQRLEAGEVVRLFQQPDEHVDRFMFWELLCQWLLLRGKAYVVALDKNGAVVPVRAGGRRQARPTRLVLLNPDRVRLERAGHELMGYRYTGANTDALPAQHFLPEEVISLRMAYAYDSLEGLPPLGVAILAAQTDYTAALFMRGLMRNNADSGLIVTTPEHFTESQRAQFQASLNERKRRAGMADRPLFLSDGATVQPPNISLADVQFLENRKFNRQEICAIFRVPQEILGYTEDANRAVAEAVRQSFVENRIAPFCQRLESALDPVVKLFGPNLWGFFDVEALPIMQAARRTRYQSARQGFEMGVPLRVLNEVFDLGLPGLPHGERCYLPTGLQEVGVSGEAARSLGGYEPKNGKMARDGSPVESLTHLLESYDRQKVAPQNSPGLEPADLAVARRIEGKLSRFLFEQRTRTLGRLEAAGLRNGASLPTCSQVFDLEAENKAALACLTPCVRELLKSMAARLGRGADFEIAENDVLEFLEERQPAWEEMNANILRQLEQAFQAREAGATLDALVKGVKAIFQSAREHAGAMAAHEVRAAWSYVKNLQVLVTH